MSWSIQIEGLGKKYRRGEVQPLSINFRESLAHFAKQSISCLNPFRPHHPPSSPRRVRPSADTIHHPSATAEFWALKDINLEVQEGEVLGIIGRNGAGKSTLLKILSRIMLPTCGVLRFRGRMASLLEVGTGFHRELTGRENVFLNGSILGMRRAEITQKFDEIVEFSGVGDFIDTPVKFFSSGMYVRLAFAVAAHLDPDILVVDEVLAVGDTAFQKKCLGKMGEVAKGGRTVLFVSHNEIAVRDMAQRGLVLQNGIAIFIGDIARAYNVYNDDLARLGGNVQWKDPTQAPGTAALRLTAIGVEGASGRITTDQPIEVTIDFKVFVPETRCGFTLLIFTADGTHVLSSMNNHDTQFFEKPLRVGAYRARATIPAMFLNAGVYSLSLLVLGRDYQQVLSLSGVIGFMVEDGSAIRRGYTAQWGGVVRPLLPWTTTRIETSAPPFASVGARD